MEFDFQPTLKGNLVILRPLCVEDYEGLYSVASDPYIWKQHPVKNRYKEKVLRTFFEAALASHGALVAIDVETNQIIGSSRFRTYNDERNEIEIGWTFLARFYWGGIYNGEIKRLMLEHAFRFVKSVIFLIGVHNFRSQKAIEKIGGTKVGVNLDANGYESYVYQINSA